MTVGVISLTQPTTTNQPWRRATRSSIYISIWATGEQTLMIPLDNSTYQKQAQYHLGDVGSSILLRSFQNTRRELTNPPASTARRCRWTRTITLRKMVPSAKCWLRC